MTVLKEVQPRVYALTGGLFANWMPPDKAEVGDYGVISRERFVRDGNLSNFQMDYDVETLPKSKGKLEYSDRAKITVGLQASAAASVPGQKPPKASAKIKFSGSGAFIYHLSGISTQRLKNARQFFEDVASKWIAGKISLEENSVIINEVRIADKATIVVSEAHDGSLELQGDFSGRGQAIFADVKGGLSVASSAGSLFQWLAADGTIPMIGLVRPVMGPLGGPPIAPTAVARFLRRIRNMFGEKQWDIRSIQLRDFIEAPGLATVTAKLPNGESVSVSFQAVDIEAFMTLNEYVAHSTSFVEDSVQKVQVSRARAAGA